MILARKLRWVCLVFLLVWTVGCDQTSKHIARLEPNRAGSITLAGGMVELGLADNSGSFLSLGALLPGPARFIVFTVGVGIAMAVLAANLIYRARMELWRFTGLSLLLAGGVSNLLDRLFRHGLVTDFITVRIGPLHTGVFNAADVLVMVGVGVLIYSIRKDPAPDSPRGQGSE